MVSRAFLEKHRTPIIVASVLAIIASFFIPSLFRRKPAPLPPAPVQKQQYFYDLSTGKLFAAGIEQVPPIPAPSNEFAANPTPRGVLAYVYSCGGCEDPAQRKIAYLETFTPEARQAKIKADAEAAIASPGRYQELATAWESGRKVAAVASAEEMEWFDAESEEAVAMVEGASQLCGEKPIEVCHP